MERVNSKMNEQLNHRRPWINMNVNAYLLIKHYISMNEIIASLS